MTWLPVVLVALVGIIPAILTWQQADAARKQNAEQARRTARLEDRKVDREELQAAVTFWKTSFDAVTLDNQQLRKDLDLERGVTRRLSWRVDKLERALRAAGLPVPNGEPP